MYTDAKRVHLFWCHVHAHLQNEVKRTWKIYQKNINNRNTTYSTRVQLFQNNVASTGTSIMFSCLTLHSVCTLCRNIYSRRYTVFRRFRCWKLVMNLHMQICMSVHPFVLRCFKYWCVTAAYVDIYIDSNWYKSTAHVYILHQTIPLIIITYCLLNRWYWQNILDVSATFSLMRFWVFFPTERWYVRRKHVSHIVFRIFWTSNNITLSFWHADSKITWMFQLQKISHNLTDKEK